MAGLESMMVKRAIGGGHQDAVAGALERHDDRRRLIIAVSYQYRFLS
ncbi:hypothetical protein [Bosea sp. (in: a-proteobacteria)]|jgi:hypothetical protein